MLRLRPPAPFLLAAALVLGTTLAAAAGGKGDAKKKHEQQDDAAGASSGGGAAFKDAVADGATKYAARDFAGAVQSFQKAIEADAKNPMGHYLLGEAELAAGNPTEAEAAWSRAALESGDQSPGLHAKVLFVLADLEERQKKWDDAKAAWQTYLDWAAKHPDAGAFPASGQSRQQRIAAMQKQDLAYVEVRKRIAETKNGNVFTDLNKPSPPRAEQPPVPASK